MTLVARIFMLSLLLVLLVPGQLVSAQDSQPQAQQRESQEPQRRRDFFSRWWRGSAQYQKTHDDVKSAYRQPAQKAVASTASVMVEDKSVALATVVDKEGYLVTKASLLPTSGKLFCKLPGSDSVEASLVGQDEEYDLALLKVEGIDLTPVQWRSDQATMGTFVAAIDPDGNVLGLGVVSTDPRAIRGERNPSPRRAWLGVSLGTGTDGTMVSNVQDRTAASRRWPGSG